MSFTYLRGAADNAAEVLAEALARQANVLLNNLDDDASFRTLSASNIFRQLSTLESEVSAQSLRKAALKAQALQSTKPSQGFQLALLLAEQVGWSGDDGSIPKHAQDWLNAALAYLASVSNGSTPLRMSVQALSALLELLTAHLLTPAAAARSEYARTIVSPTLPKLATLLTACSEVAQRTNQEQALLVLVAFVIQQLEQNPSYLRPLAPRLHAVATSLALSSTSMSSRQQGTRLLGSLHLTGAQSNASSKSKELAGASSSGKTSQAQLWSSTIKAAIGSTKETWCACVSTFQIPSHSPSKHRLELPVLDVVDYPSQWRRLESLLGENGTLIQLLQLPTKRPVPLPLRSLFRLSTAMLTTYHAKATVDANLHALQTVRLPHVQLMSLRLLAVALDHARTAGQAASAHFSPVALEMLVKLLEEASTASIVRNTALHVLAKVVVMPLDSSASVTLRISRISIAQVARLMLLDENDSTSSVAGSGSIADANGSVGRKKKRSRLYESDSITAAPSVKVLALKSHSERAAALAALRVLPALHAHLITSLTPTHYDLAHTAVQVVAGLAELTLRGIKSSEAGSKATTERLAATSLQCLSAMLRVTSGGPMLGLLTPKVSSLAQTALQVVSPSSQFVSSAANEAAAAVRDVVVPRLPPVLSGQAEEEDEGGDEASTQQQWGVDQSNGQQLQSTTGSALHPSGSGIRAMADSADKVLGVRSVAKQVGDDVVQPHEQDVAVLAAGPPLAASSPPAQRSHVFSGPRHSSPGAVQSGDSIEPTKPFRRPTTPKIGSPSGPRTSMPGNLGASPEAKEVFGRSAAKEQKKENENAAEKDGEDPFDSIPAVATSTLTVTEQTVQAKESDATVGPPARVEETLLAEDSDDEEMPSIDIGSSDEEDADN